MTDFNFPHPPHMYSMVVPHLNNDEFPKATVYIRRLEWVDKIYSRFRLDSLITCADFAEAEKVAEEVCNLINAARVLIGGIAICCVGSHEDLF